MRFCKSLSPFKKPATGNKIRIALHVRRGELLFVNSERLIDLSYYINIARSLSTTLTEVGIPFEIELHSEVLEKDTIVEPEDPAFKGRISDIDPSFGRSKTPFGSSKYFQT